jgi:hypothetical protein
VNHTLLAAADSAVGSIETDSPVEAVLEAMDRVAALKEQTRLLAELLEARVIAWIETNGDIENGDVRYYVGPNKTTRCNDLRATLTALLDACGGDMQEVCRHLSTSAFKPGACRETLAESDYAELFITAETPDLKEGKPKRRVQKFDARFQ